MPAISQSQIQTLPDILSTERFVLRFGTVPTYGDTFFALTLRCQDTQLPGVQDQSFQVMLQGHTRNFRGMRTYQHILSATIIEGADMAALTALRQWKEFVVGTDSGSSGGYIAMYSVTATLEIYDVMGNLADFCNIYRCYIHTIQDGQMSGTGSQPFMVSADFQYDYIEYNNVAIS